jgi:hypothetical protein
MSHCGSPLTIWGNFKWQHAFVLAWIQIEPGLMMKWNTVLLLTTYVQVSSAAT